MAEVNPVFVTRLSAIPQTTVRAISIIHALRATVTETFPLTRGRSGRFRRSLSRSRMSFWMFANPIAKANPMLCKISVVQLMPALWVGMAESR